MFASTSAIDRPLSTLVIDTSTDLAQLESGLSARLFNSLTRRGLRMVGEGPTTGGLPEESAHLEASIAEASCLVALGGGDAASTDRMEHLVDWLASTIVGPKLFAVFTWDAYDPALSARVLDETDSPAVIAVAQRSPVAPRAGALYLLKFLTEVHLHSDDRITGRMAWFAWAKANELMKRRRMDAAFGLKA